MLTDANSTFATLVAAFAAQGVKVTPEGLASDNASTPNLVRAGGLWLCQPMIAIAPSPGKADTLARIATRYALINGDGSPDVARVARTNAAVLGFVASGVSLTYGGATLVTNANDTLNALITRFTIPGTPPPSIDDLANALAEVELVPASMLVLPVGVESAISIALVPTFVSPIVRLGVTVTETRAKPWIADAFQNVISVGMSLFDVPPQALAAGTGGGVLSLDAFATAVETALPGVRVATGDPPIETDDASERRLWLVNFNRQAGSPIGFQFKDASAVRSFAIPPLSTSLASGTAMVTPYVTGKGLIGTPRPVVFASIDLDVWGAMFLTAMDVMLSPIYAVPANEESPADFEKIVAAKQALARSIAGRVQYIMDGGGPGEYGDADRRRASAIAAMEQALLVVLSSAYSITSLVQVAVDVTSPYTDSVKAPRLSGKPTLTQTETSAPVRNASLSTAKVALTQTTTADPVLATFLLTMQSPARQRNATVDLAYAVAEIEVPSGLPDPDGFQSSSWLTLVHPLDDTRSKVAQVTIPIPLRAYPLSPTLVSQSATLSYPKPTTVAELVRWDADAVYSHQDADQDTGRLKLEINDALGTRDRLTALGDGDPIFLALAESVSVYPALQADLALLTSRAPTAPTNPTTKNAVTAFATLAAAVAAAWPKNAVVHRPASSLVALQQGDEIVPGTYAYTLIHPDDGPTNLTRLELIADQDNTAMLWPQLAVDTRKGQGFRALTFDSASGPIGVYRYPPDVPKGITLAYEVGLPKLDVVMIADLKTSVAVQRNADLIEGKATCQLFVYSAPYTSFSSPLVPLLVDDSDFDIGSGSIGDLGDALKSFLTALLVRSAAPAGTTRGIRVAGSFGYELTLPVTTAAVRSRAAAALDDEGISTYFPIVLVPSVELTINGDGGAKIDAFANELGAFVAGWVRTVQPSTVNAAVFFDVSLFSGAIDSNDKPLLEVRSVRYSLV